MRDRPFLDTNIFIYALERDTARGQTANALLENGGIVSAQVLNEFADVARRKLGMAWPALTEALSLMRDFCPDPVPVTADLHDAGMRLSQRFGYRLYDALIVAAALEAKCVTLYSEDMQDGQVIEGLTVRNPFAPPSLPVPGP